MMKNNLVTGQHDDGNHQEDDQWIKRAIRTANPKNLSEEPTKKDKSSSKKSASILGASGYVFQGQMGDALTPSSSNDIQHPDHNQNFQALDDRASMPSRAESNKPSHASDASKNQTNSDSSATPTTNTDTATNNASLPNQEAITNLAAPFIERLASISKGITASLPQKMRQPLIQITNPKSPIATSPSTPQTAQNPLLQVKHPALDPEAAFVKEEMLAERKRKKEDEERVNQNRLAIQEFASKEAAGETAEMYHDLAEDIIDDAYLASFEDNSDFEINEEEIASINRNKSCKNILDRSVPASIAAVAATAAAASSVKNQAERNKLSGSIEITAEGDETSSKKQTDTMLASTNTTIPNYLDIPPKDVMEHADKPTQAKV